MASRLGRSDRVHLLPCSIKHDSPCDVSHYFRPRKSDVTVDGLSVEVAFFRGRRLQGTAVPLPDGYRGYVLGKKKSGNGKANAAGEEEFGQWAAHAEFQNIDYWNHDSAPSRDDPLMRSFHWFSIADAVKVKNVAPPAAPVPTPARPAPAKPVSQVVPAAVSAPTPEALAASSNSTETTRIQEAEVLISTSTDSHSVYIKNLPLSATPAQLEEEFKKFGSIKTNGL